MDMRLGGVAQVVRACGSYPQCPGFNSLRRHRESVNWRGGPLLEGDTPSMEHLQEDIQKKLFERFGRTCKGGENIFTIGEPADQVFMILSGRVRLVKLNRGVMRDIAILKAGDVFGETALLPGQRRFTSAVALGDLEVLAFKAQEFETLLHEQAKISAKLVLQLIRRILAAEEQIENMLLKDVESKIVNTLLKMADGEGGEGSSRQLSVTPLELASRIGIDVDSAKRGIQNLRKKHYLRIVNERLEVVDIESLRKLSELLGMKEDLMR